MQSAAILRSGAHDRGAQMIPGFGHDTWWLILAKALAVFVFLVLTVLVAILAERKILGRMQMRWGPNRVGPRGYLQSLADGIKLALKEPITPFGVEKPIFLVAPAISTIPAITAFAFIPFGPQVSVFGHWTALQVTDLPVAVLFILALSSIGVYGIVLAGWSSGSTYPLLGGVRSTAQVISYEVAMGLSFATVFLFAGTMSTSQIVAAQDRVWYVFLLLPSFTTYLVSMVGETNRAPFDLPEAEGELVAGFHTEYSSLSFAMFYLAEYINMTTVSALAATLFMGGWHAPWPLNMWAGANSGWWPVLWFTAKVWVFLFFYIWLRGTLPRLRYDQFMALGWKLLIPVSLIWALIAAAIRTLRDQGYPHWTPLLVGASIVVTVVLLYLLQRPFSNRQIRNRRRRNEPVEAGASASLPPAFPTPPLPGQSPVTASKEAAHGEIPEFDRRIRRHVRLDVQTARHRELPGAPRPGEAALPRPSSADPLRRRPGEVHRLRTVRVVVSGRRDLCRRRRQHRRGTLFAGRALRPGLPDQLPALHRMRVVRRSLPDPCADDDQPLRDGRRQPGRPDLREAGPTGSDARRNDTGAASQGRRIHRRRLLPRQHHRQWPAPTTDFGRLEVTTLLAADAITRTSTGEAVTFWILGTLALIGALGVVMAANAVYCAMSLAMTMIVLAVFYMIEGALFLGVVQIVVYTGAVMMLFLFVLMLIGVDSAESLVETLRGQRVASVVAGLAFGIVLIAGIGNVATQGYAGLTQANAGGNVQGLAALIFSQYLWAFELTSALLITAAIGAMVLAHRERFERRKTQREMSVERFQPCGHPTPLPGPGVFARRNAVDTPARLPDGSPSRLSVPAVLELRPVQDRDLPPSHGSNGSGNGAS